MVIAAALAAVLAFFLFDRWRKRAAKAPNAHDTTAALEAWLREALEAELAGSVGLARASGQERRPLTKTLANEPDPEIVSKLEDAVRAIELEFVRYAHEPDIEVTVRVRYANGEAGATSRRLASADVPPSVLADFSAKSATRVFRSWGFPWQRATMS